MRLVARIQFYLRNVHQSTIHSYFKFPYFNYAGSKLYRGDCGSVGLHWHCFAAQLLPQVVGELNGSLLATQDVAVLVLQEVKLGFSKPTFIGLLELGSHEGND